MDDLHALNCWANEYASGETPLLNTLAEALHIDPIICIRLLKNRMVLLEGELSPEETEMLSSTYLQKIKLENDTPFFMIYKEYSKEPRIVLSTKPVDRNLDDLFSIAFAIIDQHKQIVFLDNSLKIMKFDLGMFNPPTGDLNTELPEGFINAVVPGVAYSVVHEIYGPSFISAWPPDFGDVANTLMVVNIYSTLNSEQIARMGHLSSNLVISKPEEGELMNIIFTIPNEDARGKNEMHAISILIGQEFVNLSKLLVFHIKSLHFTSVELVRQKVVMEEWNFSLESDDLKSDKIVDEFQPILKNLRLQIANLFALQIGEHEVSKFNI